MNYQHFSMDERCCLRKYYKEGHSIRKIAELLGRSPSTISWEIKRNQVFAKGEVTYYPHRAQKKYQWRRSFCHRGLFNQVERGAEKLEQKVMTKRQRYGRIKERRKSHAERNQERL